ncbi:MAG: hypothetical protein WD021_11085 [Rhodothermales bacterium]
MHDTLKDMLDDLEPERKDAIKEALGEERFGALMDAANGNGKPLVRSEMTTQQRAEYIRDHGLDAFKRLPLDQSEHLERERRPYSSLSVDEKVGRTRQNVELKQHEQPAPKYTPEEAEAVEGKSWAEMTEREKVVHIHLKRENDD